MNRVYVSLVGWLAAAEGADLFLTALVFFLCLPPVICVVGLMANPRRLVPRARRASAAHGMSVRMGARGVRAVSPKARG